MWDEGIDFLFPKKWQFLMSGELFTHMKERTFNFEGYNELVN